jgi:hypothetical protein
MAVGDSSLLTVDWWDELATRQSPNGKDVNAEAEESTNG